jgi:hypothetical protein
VKAIDRAKDLESLALDKISRRLDDENPYWE